MMQATNFKSVVFFALGFYCCMGTNEKCVYKGSMCNIDIQECVRYGEECEMSYPTFYKTEAVVEFMVNISNLSLYPKDLSMYIMRYQNGNGTPVKNCCDLKLNESCALPGFIGTQYMLFAPITRGRLPYCTKEIIAFEAIQPKFCDEDPQLPCLVMKDGKVEVEKDFDTISTLQYSSPMDYCIFYAPESYDKRGKSKSNGLSTRVEGITLNGTEVNGEDFNTSCTVIEEELNFNLTHDLFYNNPHPGFVKCTFIRVKRLGRDWTEYPICASARPRDWSHVIIAITTAVIFVIFVIVSAVLCKKYARAFVPSYKASVGEGIVSLGLDFEKEDYFTKSDKDETAPKERKSKGRRGSNNDSIRYVSVYSNATPSPHRAEERICEIIPQNQNIENEISPGDTTSLNGIMITIKRNPEDLTRATVPVVASDISVTIDVPNSKLKGQIDASPLPTDLNDNQTIKTSCQGESIATENDNFKSGQNFNYIAKRSTVLTAQHQCSHSLDTKLS